MLNLMRMHIVRSSLWLLLPFASMAAPAHIAVEWAAATPKATVTATGATVSAIKEIPGRARIEFMVSDAGPSFGEGAAIVTVSPSGGQAFSFFARDVRRASPIWIPAYEVAITEASDARGYREIAEAIRARGAQTKLGAIENAAEASWNSAAAKSRDVKVQTWLGLSRDIRIFSINERLDTIQTRLHGQNVRIPDEKSPPVTFGFLAGRGWGASDHIVRRLEDGVLPILHGELRDDEITYAYTTFVSLETTPLTAGTVRGTHYLVADGYGAGHMFTKSQQAEFDRTVVGRDDLKNAMEAPEKYPHVLVRLGGWSARFIDLEKRTQQEILRRTLY